MTLKVTTLDNGLRVISEEIPYLETASVGVWVDAGARCEQPEINGISHLLEHMAFKGTKIRSARDIAEEIEAVGGHLNAYTSREQTAYFAKVLKEDTPLALDILADILQNPAFDKDELEREQTVVVQEIGQAHDTPDDIIFDYFQDIAFPDQPLGRPVLGTSENVQSFTRDNLSAYMDQQVGFQDTLLAGLAPDGGLYVPADWPQIRQQSHTLAGPYERDAAALMNPFVDGDIDISTLTAITRAAYAKFGHKDVAPLVEIGDGHWLLELFHGPTLSFKDFALQVLGGLFEHPIPGQVDVK